MMALPESFTTYTRSIMGRQLFDDFLASFVQDIPVSIRVNRSKWTAAPLSARQVPWCSDGYYLASRPNFTFDPLFHAGCYYVQEASSMFVCQALRQYVDADRPLTVLDMCAAPGGKSTAVLSMLPEGSVMICNEPIRQRAQVLAENMHKWGNPNTIVTNNYPDDYARLDLNFDLIICDVPCSGEGMFRKDEGAVGEWSVQNVEKCRTLQREIVDKVWPLLRPGGLMVYSTCTFNTREDEENVDWICREHDAELLPVVTQDEWHITPSLLKGFDSPVYRFIPGRTLGEGIFMAVLRKGGEPNSVDVEHAKRKERKVKKMKSKEKTTKSSGANGLSWLDGRDAFTVVGDKDVYYAVSNALMPVYSQVKEALRLLKVGITLGQVKGNDLIPSQSLALSTSLAPCAFPQVELDYSQAIAYLRREPVALPSSTPRGYVLVTFRQKPLGLMKNIGNRANNLYPAEWKIKSSHIPEECRIL